jgi:tyrosyl-tRNA synthetase
MDIEQQINLIKRNLQEIIGEEELREKLTKNKTLSIYWGTMPTGSPHIAYFLPLLKIRDFLNAGLKVKILIADLHAALDGVSWEILEKRQKYYETLIPLMLKSLGVNIRKLEFMRGSKIQRTPEYFEDLLKLTMMTSVKEATKAASEVVKMDENPRLGNLLYPLMQALDEEYLKVDAQFGGVDQRKIFVFARENLPKLGYKSRIELMNPIIPGLIGKKMSSSVQNSKIDVLDKPETIRKKINGAECEIGNPDNGIMAFLKYVIFTLKEDRGEKLCIKRPDKFGGDKEYENYESLEKEFIEKKIHPQDLKNSITEEIINLLKPLEKSRKIIEEAFQEAYL